MRVALVGDYPLNDEQIQGGVQSAFAYLVRGLCRIDGLEVHVVTQSRRGRVTQDNDHADGPILHVLPPFPRMELARNFKTYQERLNHTLAHIKPDVIHAQGGTDDAYVSLRSGYPAVVTVHGVHSEDGKYSRTFRLRLRNFLYSALVERYVVRHTRFLIAIGRYVARYYASQLRRDVQIEYVPNAIDESFFNLPGGGDGRTILYAGRVIQRKRVFDLVRAFAQAAEQLPDAQLRIAGEYVSEGTYAESIRDFIRSANLGDRVHLLGPLLEADVLREFAACDVLALTSAQETTPMVIAQAMAAGKPIVATPVGGIPEMVQDGETGCLAGVGDIAGIAGALSSLLRDESLRTRMGQAGRAFAVENYRAEGVARRTFDFYRRIAAAKA